VNKTVKNVVIGFTMLMIVVCAVFLIELMLLNRGGVDEDAVPPLVIASPPASPDGPSPGSGSQQGGASPSESPGQPDDSRPQPSGRRYEMEMPGDTVLVAYAEEELFEYTVMDSEDVLSIFRFRGSGIATLEIRFAFMPDGVDAFAESFFEMNMEIEDSTVLGLQAIRSSSLRGVLVTATENGSTYEVWIYSFPGPELDGIGLAFVTYYQNDMQKYNLYDILNSLEIILESA